MSDPLPPSSSVGRGDASAKLLTAPVAEQAHATDTTPPKSASFFLRAPVATRAMLVVAVAVAVAAAALAWFDARRTQDLLRSQVAQRLADIDAAREGAQKAQSQFTTELRDAQAKVTLLEARLAESQAQQAALEALYRDLAPSRDEIALTEIEQVLLIASQQLQLAGNVQSALSALQLADSKLQRLDRPQFLSLKRAITRDIDRLKAMPFVDVDGMSLKLDQALATIDTLPLAIDERLPPPVNEKATVAGPKTAWQVFLQDVWTDIRQLVRIEVSDRPLAPVVAPPQQYFLRENLKLRLLAARVALFNRHDASFKADVGAADKWLKQYFDTRSKPVQSVQATLKQLSALPATGEAPDLAASLEAMRALRLAQDRGPARYNERANVSSPVTPGSSVARPPR